MDKVKRKELIKNFYALAIESASKSALQELANKTGDERIEKLIPIIEQVGYNGNEEELLEAFLDSSTEEISNLLADIAVDTGEKVGKGIISSIWSFISKGFGKLFG